MRSLRAYLRTCLGRLSAETVREKVEVNFGFHSIEASPDLRAKIWQPFD